jgi:hypothetical protein
MISYMISYSARFQMNNQASYGGRSIRVLKANKEVDSEAAIELAHDLDETGMPCVFIGVGITVGLFGVLLGFSERG